MATTACGGLIMGCMCAECMFSKIVQDENGDLFAICPNRKSENFLKEISFAFDRCDFGMVDDEDE